MPTVGYKPGASATSYGFVGTANSVNQRASISINMPEHAWPYQISIRGGRRETTIPRVALAIWATDAAAAPDTLMARTAEFTTGTYMLDQADGTSYTRDLQTTAKLRSGKRYALGFVASDAQFGYGVQPLANLPAGESGDVYRRTVAGGPTPQDPFGYTSIGSGTGWIAVWVDYEANVAPNIPTSTTPSNGASVSTLTPTFTGLFRDDNETLPNGLAGDSLASVQIQVRLAGTTALLWNVTYNASSAERAARQFSAVYAGSPLATGNQYEWRARVFDQFGAASGWTNEPNTGQAWDTFLTSAGYVTNDTGTPTGKQETQTPGPFTAVWHTATATNATAAQIEIVNTTTGGVVRSSSMIPLSPPVANGGTISVSWAQTGFAPLDWGGQYGWRIRVDDASTATSNWTSTRAFTTNAVPTIPTLIYPDNGAATSARPELIAFSTDADDLAGGEHVVTARIKDSAGAVLQTRAMTYDAVTQTFRYQTTTTDLPTPGTYRWDAYAYDGTVYSSGNTVLGAAALSTEVTFVYESGPVVTNVSPANNAQINTNTPLYTWSVTGQVRKRVRVYDAAVTSGTELMIYDSGQISDAIQSFRQPAGYLQDDGRYYRVVEVWNASNQRGTSAPAYFTVEYSQAGTITNFTASAHRARFDVNPTSVLLSWDPTTYTAGQFNSYIITRRASTETLFDPDDLVKGENRRIAVITSPSQTTFVDYLPASGVEYTYGISQIIEISDDLYIRSPISRVTLSVAFEETVICDARQGGARRIVLAARRDRTITRNREQRIVTPWNTSKPVIFRTNRWYREISGEFQIVGDTPADVQEQIAEIEKLDQRGGPLCYRDGRGHRYFGEITEFQEIDPPGGRVRRVQLTFLQTSAAEVPDA